MRFASPWQSGGAAVSDPRSDGGLPASERGWASEARQPAGSPARELAPRDRGSVAGRDAGTKPSRRCGNVVRTIRRVIATLA